MFFNSFFKVLIKSLLYVTRPIIYKRVMIYTPKYGLEHKTLTLEYGCELTKNGVR